MATLLTLLLVFLPANSQTLKQKIFWQKSNELIKAFESDLQNGCGKHIELSVQHDPFKGWESASDAVDRCAHTLDQIVQICKASPEGKAAVVGKIQKAVCQERDAQQPETYSLKAGVFSYAISVQQFNQNDADWLKRHLASENLKSAEVWAHIHKVMDEETQKMNSACEANIKVTIDEKSFTDRPSSELNASYCDRMTTMIHDRCQDDAKHNALLKVVKSLTCRAAGVDESHFTSLKNGNLLFTLGKGGGLEDRVLQKDLDSLINN